MQSFLAILWTFYSLSISTLLPNSNENLFNPFHQNCSSPENFDKNLDWFILKVSPILIFSYMFAREMTDMLIFGSSYFLSFENWLSMLMCGISLFLYVSICSIVAQETILTLAAIGNMIAFLVVMLHW